MLVLLTRRGRGESNVLKNTKILDDEGFGALNITTLVFQKKFDPDIPSDLPCR